MARTYNNLWPQLTSWENLVRAWQKCRRGKRHKPGAVAFFWNWESELLRLQHELRSRTWVPGNSRVFRILQPKPRLISAAPFRDRVVHHALVNVLEPLFERRFVYDSYACRRGRGTHRAIRRASYFMNRHRFLLKTDIIKFFPSIDHQCLLQTVKKVIADPEVLQLIEVILAAELDNPVRERVQHWFPGDDLFAVLRPGGLPIGNLTSQFFANVFLDRIDHFILEDLKVPGYVRYADDLLLFGDSSQQLHQAIAGLIPRLAQIRLKLHPTKTVISPCEYGIPFLGFHVCAHSRRLLQEGIHRFNRRRRQWERAFANGTLDLNGLQKSLEAWFAHTQHGNTQGIRKTLVGKIRLKKKRTARQAE